jgi:hypothetical protein
MQISPQLTRTIAPFIPDFLNWTGRNYRHNYHDFNAQLWQQCLWIEREGFISYRELSKFIDQANFAASMQRESKQISRYHFAVKGNHQPWYTVEVRNGKYKCDCPRWRCWENRLSDELPILRKYWRDYAFCPHTQLIKNDLAETRLNKN